MLCIQIRVAFSGAATPSGVKRRRRNAIAQVTSQNGVGDCAGHSQARGRNAEGPPVRRTIWIGPMVGAVIGMVAYVSVLGYASRATSSASFSISELCVYICVLCIVAGIGAAAGLVLSPWLRKLRAHWSDAPTGNERFWAPGADSYLDALKAQQHAAARALQIKYDRASCDEERNLVKHDIRALKKKYRKLKLEALRNLFFG